jgi:hypothetical protein
MLEIVTPQSPIAGRDVFERTDINNVPWSSPFSRTVEDLLLTSRKFVVSSMTTSTSSTPTLHSVTGGGGKFKQLSRSQPPLISKQDSGTKLLSLMFSFPMSPKEHISSLTNSLKTFTKKTGAGYQKPNSNDSMIELIETFGQSLHALQQILSCKQILCDLRLQSILLTPWIAHFDQLLNNILRILNDRVSMLWRKGSSSNSSAAAAAGGSSASPYRPFESACGLHDDVNEIMSVLQKVLVVFSPKQFALKKLPSYGERSLQSGIPKTTHQQPSQSHHSSTLPPALPSSALQQSNPPTTSSSILPLPIIQHSNPPVAPPSASSTATSPTNPSNRVVDCELGILSKQLITRCRFHLLRSFPSLLNRIEQYLTSILLSSLAFVCNQFLIKNCFLLSKRSLSSKQLDSPTSIHMFGYTLRDSLLQPILLSIKIYCKSKLSIERIMTLCVNTSVEYVLNDIKGKRLRFNEYGVYILYTLLNTVLQWTISSKTDLAIPPSSPLITDHSPWLRANAILQVLLSATSGELIGVQAVMDPKEHQQHSHSPQGSRYTSLTHGELSSGTALVTSSTKKKLRHLTIFEYERWVELGIAPKICCVSIEYFPSFVRNRRSTGVVSLSTTLDIRDI